ncbi:CoA-transferase family III [Annulohypoxylon maeteangense]|uniref:CoA-transferase family III n=1 Tax=Annulohypoxylon maeteangense TaxID=1927788 RepID=UPI002007D8F9|nr:CoA-transferase family III [Annulohypoxylon maeteangense]KAI0880713.1 CoA-transferase family III [Annulohypoxylon maeteangense]
MAEDIYTIQKEASRLLTSVLLTDARLQIPESVKSASKRTSFDPSALATPFLPAPIKCTELSTALWALLATFGNAICAERYGLSEQKVVINSDVASIFLISFWLMRVGGKPISDSELVKRYSIYDTTNQFTLWRRLVTNLYPTRDGRWFHLHGGLNSDRSLRMLGLPTHKDVADEMEAVKGLSEGVQQFDAEWLDIEANEYWRQAGGICFTPEEYRKTEQGKAIADDALYLLEEFHGENLPPVPWPRVDTKTYRPLEGIKIVDLTRAIAGPTIGKLAALFGATVVRVSNMKLPDLGIVLFESNMGKRDAHLDLKAEEGRKALLNLIEDADVVLDGYRPGALEKLGFGPTYVHEVARRRGKGIVYARENCYGWKGPWMHRSGWQQISDAVTGVAWLFARMWNVDEPMMPFLPNSDFQTGIVGCIGVMNALDKRAKKGGNYLVSMSLNQLNSFLISLGTQSPEVQQSLREMWPDMKLRHYDDIHRQMRVLLSDLPKVKPQLLNPKYFTTIKAELGVPDEEIAFVGPAATYDTTKLGYDLGSCLRGTHEAKWPDEG